MSDYLDRIGAGYIFKLDDDAPDPFSFDYLPPKLVGRDEELKRLASKFVNISQIGSSSRVMLTGMVGTGKTAISRRFVADIKKKLLEKRSILSVHVNCRTHNSTSQVLNQIVNSLDKGHPERGLSSGELLLSIRKIIRNSNSHMIVILDEANHVFRKDGNNLFYQLLRIDEDKEGHGTLSLILISQEDLTSYFEPAVMSRFGRTNHIRLNPYSKDQLKEIIVQRAEIGLNVASVPDEIFEMISISASKRGDARLAIELLQNAAIIAESEGNGRAEINSTDVQKASSQQSIRLSDDIEANVVDQFNKHVQMLLLAICRRLRKNTEMTSGDAEKLYHVICEEFECKPKGHTTLWKYLKKLEDENLITSRTSNVSDGRGRTQYLSMPTISSSDVAERLEYNLNL